WDSALPGFIFAHNNTPRDGEGYSPAYLVYMQEMSQPADVLGKETVYGDQDEMIEKDIAGKVVTTKLLRDYRMRRAKAVAERYDERGKDVELKIGEEAYLFDHTVGRIGNKLTKRWTGPWIVKELRGKNAAVLEREGRTTVQNISAIMPIGPKWDPEDMKMGPVGGPDELMEGEVISEVTKHLSEKATTAQLDDDKIRKQVHEEIGVRKRESKEGKKLAEERKCRRKKQRKKRQSRRRRKERTRQKKRRWKT